MRPAESWRRINGRFAIERSRAGARLAFWCAVIALVSLIADACAKRVRPAPPAPAQPSAREVAFTATAYCTGKITATGTAPNEKTIAADPAVLPMGSRIKLSGLDKRYNRVYTVGDTGSSIRGRRIDLYMRDCREAVAFGRRSATVSVLR
jgi:3D (Asp-Asp-Asp) domain-containing protein